MLVVGPTLTLLLLPLGDGEAGLDRGACCVDGELVTLAALTGFDWLVDAFLIALVAAGALRARLVTFLLLLCGEVQVLDCFARIWTRERTFSLLQMGVSGAQVNVAEEWIDSPEVASCWTQK